MRRRGRSLLLVVGALSLLALSRTDGFAAEQGKQVSGAWRIEPLPNESAAGRESVLVTAAIGDKEASFGLWCRPDTSIYTFVVRAAQLAALPTAEDVPLAIRVADGELVRFAATSRGDGRVIIQERVHQTAFALILDALKQGGATFVEITVEDHAWAFPLDGFAAAIPLLVERCGFPIGSAAGETGERPGLRPNQPPRTLPAR